MKYAVLVLLLLLAACGANTAVTATPTAMIATKSSALQPTSPTATLASPQATPTTGTSTNLPIATVAQPTVTPMPVPTSTPIAIPLVAPTSVPATSTPTVLIPPQSPTIAANPTTTYIASFPFRVEVQKTWTEQQAGKGAVYYIQVGDRARYHTPLPFPSLVPVPDLDNAIHADSSETLSRRG